MHTGSKPQHQQVAVRSADSSSRAAGATAPEVARSQAVRQLIARSVLHGPALRTLLAAGR
jgi:hypothetical protein